MRVVSTVAELEELPEGAVVVGTDGVRYEHRPFVSDGWPWMGSNEQDWAHEDLLANYGPVKVVSL